MKHNQKGFSLVGALLAAAVIVVVGGVAYYVNRINNEAPLNSQNNSDSSKFSNIPALDAASNPEVQLPDDYENYENQEIGFKYKYPKTWTSFDDGGAAEFLHKLILKSPDYKINGSDNLGRTEAGGIISVQVHKSDFQTTEEFKEKAQDFDVSAAEDIVVGGISALRDVQCGHPKTELICTIVVKNSYYYQLNYAYSISESPSSAKYLGVYKKMIDSFSFTK